MQGLPRLTVGQLSRLLNAGAITSEQVCAFCYTLAMAGQDLWKLHAFERLVPREELLHQARQSDQRRRDGLLSSTFLDGIPVSIKANIAVASQPLTAGSKVLGAGSRSYDRTPPPVGYSADVSRILLKDCGAVLVGVTAMDEFGMGSLGINTVCTRDVDGDRSLPDSTSKNPLWLLQRIGGVHSLSDEDLVQQLQLPHDAIWEAHVNAVADDNEIPPRSAGGSSCGSAISVAHGSSVISLGSDTGGSVRLPAAWCGITGLKPSYGLLSRDGLVSYASSMDTIGILANSAHCAAVALEHLVGQESRRDSTLTKSPHYSITSSVVKQESSGGADDSTLLADLTVGIPAAFSVQEAPDRIRDAWLQGAQLLEHYGATVRTVSPERLSARVLQNALAAYYVLAAAEASSNLARYDGFRYGISIPNNDLTIEEESSDLSLLEQQYAATRTHGFGSEVIRRVLCGTSVLSSDRFHTYYEAAAMLRAILVRQMEDSLTDCNVLLVPTAVFAPPVISGEINQTEMFANDVMTVPISMSGLPAISVPFGRWDDFSPTKAALQLVAARHDEQTLVRVAGVLEVAGRTKWPVVVCKCARNHKAGFTV